MRGEGAYAHCAAGGGGGRRAALRRLRLDPRAPDAPTRLDRALVLTDPGYEVAGGGRHELGTVTIVPTGALAAGSLRVQVPLWYMNGLPRCQGSVGL